MPLILLGHTGGERVVQPSSHHYISSKLILFTPMFTMESQEEDLPSSMLSEPLPDSQVSLVIDSQQLSQVVASQNELDSQVSVKSNLTSVSRVSKGSKAVRKGNRDPEKGDDSCIWFITVPALFVSKKKPKKGEKTDLASLKKECKATAFAEWEPFCEQLIVAAESHELHIFLRLIRDMSFEDINKMCEVSFGKHCNIEKPRRPEKVIKYVTKEDYPVPMLNIPLSQTNRSYQLMHHCTEMARQGSYDPTNYFIRGNICYCNLAKHIVADMIKDIDNQEQCATSLSSFKFCQWMITVLEWFKKRPGPRTKSLYLFGLPESYKTSFIKYVLRCLDKTTFFAENSADFSLQGYRQEEAIVLNDFNLGTMSETLKLNLFENTEFRIPCKGGMSVYKARNTYNIVTSNISPHEGEWSLALRSRMQVVHTDQLMMKVESEVQEKWQTWLDNGGIEKTDTIIISDDEVEEIDTQTSSESECSYNPCSCMGCAFGLHCGNGDCCDNDEYEENTPENSQNEATPVEVAVEPIEEDAVPSTSTEGAKPKKRSIWDVEVYSPPDPGLCSSEEEPDALDCIDFENLSQNAPDSPPRKKRCAFIESDCSEAESDVETKPETRYGRC